MNYTEPTVKAIEKYIENYSKEKGFDTYSFKLGVAISLLGEILSDISTKDEILGRILKNI